MEGWGKAGNDFQLSDQALLEADVDEICLSVESLWTERRCYSVDRSSGIRVTLSNSAIF